MKRLIFAFALLLVGCKPAYVQPTKVCVLPSPCEFKIIAGKDALLGVCVDAVSTPLFYRDQGRVRLVDPSPKTGGTLHCARVSQEQAAQLGYDGSGDRPVRQHLELELQGRTASFLINEDPGSGDDPHQIVELAGEINGPITIQLFNEACAAVTEETPPALVVVLQEDGPVLAHRP